MDEARQIRGGGADALGALEAPVFRRASALRRPRELRDTRAGKTGRPESGVLQTGAVQDLALQQLEEGRAAFALGGDGEQRVAVVAVGELPARAARQRQDGLLCLVDVGDPFGGISGARQAGGVREQLVERQVSDPVLATELPE